MAPVFAEGSLHALGPAVLRRPRRDAQTAVLGREVRAHKRCALISTLCRQKTFKFMDLTEEEKMELKN